MFCQYCGRQIPDNSINCPACGAPLKPARKSGNNTMLYIICAILGVVVIGGIGFLCYKLINNGNETNKVIGDTDVVVRKPEELTGSPMNVVSSSLNLRASDSETSEKICVLYFGSKVEVLDYTPGWSRVKVVSPSQYVGTLGYVASKYLVTPDEYNQICALFDQSMREKAKYQSYIFLPLLQYCTKKYSSSYIKVWRVIDLQYEGSRTYYYIRNRETGEERVIEYDGVINGSPVFHDYPVR